MTGKHFIFSIIFLGYGIFAYNRKGVSYTIPVLIKDGMPSEHVGLIMSAQNMAYAISKFMGGVASDRLSSRTLFSLGLFASGLTAFLFAMSNSVPLFVAAWFLNGLAQGVGWPAIAKLLKAWFKPVELGLWWSAASASANLSGVVGPVVAGALVMNFGWRLSLIANGAMSLAAAVIVYLFIKDAPATGERVTSGSPKKGTKKTAQSDSSKSTVIPFSQAMGTLLRRPNVWVISFAYLAVSCVKTGVSDWAQIYLTSELGMSRSVATTFLGSFELGGFFGGILAGYGSDYILRKYGLSRLYPAFALTAITAQALGTLSGGVNHRTGFVFMQALSVVLGASVFGQIALLGIAATETVPNQISGTSHAIAALAANAGSVIAGLPCAWLANRFSWSFVFFALSALNASSLLVLLLPLFQRGKPWLPHSMQVEAEKKNR